MELGIRPREFLHITNTMSTCVEQKLFMILLKCIVKTSTISTYVKKN